MERRIMDAIMNLAENTNDQLVAIRNSVAALEKRVTALELQNAPQ